MIGPARTVESENISEWCISPARNSGASALGEIEQFHHAIRTDPDVPWLQIATNCPLFMSGFERLGNLPGDAQAFAYHDWVNPIGSLYHDT